MKKIIGLICVTVLLVFSMGFVFATNAYATDDCVPTAILGNDGDSKYCESTDGGNGTIYILNLVVDIMMGLIGVLGVIGFVVVGIQYMTAGGNEAQMTKAKRRILEIVLGLVLFGCMYGLLKWLGVGSS